jgi:hypothetical protein
VLLEETSSNRVLVGRQDKALLVGRNRLLVERLVRLRWTVILESHKRNPQIQRHSFPNPLGHMAKSRVRPSVIDIVQAQD